MMEKDVKSIFWLSNTVASTFYLIENKIIIISPLGKENNWFCTQEAIITTVV